MSDRIPDRHFDASTRKKYAALLDACGKSHQQTKDELAFARMLIQNERAGADYWQRRARHAQTVMKWWIMALLVVQAAAMAVVLWRA